METIEQSKTRIDKAQMLERYGDLRLWDAECVPHRRSLGLLYKIDGRRVAIHTRYDTLVNLPDHIDPTSMCIRDVEAWFITSDYTEIYSSL